MEITYSNPRMSVVIENWPSGSKRVTTRFEIEQGAKLARIVDGSDGRTYIAEFTSYGHINISRGDMKFSQETIFERDPRYAMALELFA